MTHPQARTCPRCGEEKSLGGFTMFDRICRECRPLVDAQRERIRRLPATDRRIVRLREEGLAPRQIAMSFPNGLTEGWVERRLDKFRRQGIRV